mmetsp:Transcript_7731/g.15823  ORF Transcript_7731/g.15823 Transcript_7731/m.15823 type:complete len:241 (-) Transcript_7731:6-728(-)
MTKMTKMTWINSSTPKKTKWTKTTTTTTMPSITEWPLLPLPPPWEGFSHRYSTWPETSSPLFLRCPSLPNVILPPLLRLPLTLVQEAEAMEVAVVTRERLPLFRILLLLLLAPPPRDSIVPPRQSIVTADGFILATSGRLRPSRRPTACSDVMIPRRQNVFVPRTIITAVRRRRHRHCSVLVPIPITAAALETVEDIIIMEITSIMLLRLLAPLISSTLCTYSETIDERACFRMIQCSLR